MRGWLLGSIAAAAFAAGSCSSGKEGRPDGVAPAGDAPAPTGDAPAPTDAGYDSIRVDATRADSAGSTDEQTCTQFVASSCHAYQRCAPEYVPWFYGDLDTCVARQKASCLAALRADGSGATSSQLEACASAREGISCDDLLSNNPPAPCAIHGSLTPGAPCGSDWQCAGAQGYCQLGMSSLCGTCQVRAAAGGACIQDVDCQKGLRCGNPRGAAGAWTCVAPLAAGGTCDGQHPCLGTLVCLDGTCAPPLVLGEPCDYTHGDTYDYDCDILRGRGNGHYCFPPTGVCTQIQISRAGEACNTSSTACAQVTVCTYPVPTVSEGTCSAPVPEGAACAPVAGMVCAPPAQCLGGVCTLADATACR